LYGSWGIRGLIAYAVGFLVSVPFFVVPNVYTGPIASLLGGVDIGWLVSAVAASATYLLVSFRFNAANERVVPIAGGLVTNPQIPTSGP